MPDAPVPVPDDLPDDVIAERRRAVHRTGGPEEWRRGLITGGRGMAAPGRPAHDEAWRQRHWSSRTLHRFGEASAHAGAGLVAATFVLVWMGVGLATGFPEWWETVLYSTSAAVTVVMVFAIQHTQSREQSATQRKLDELLRAQPAADDALIAVEEAPDHELEARASLNLADRRKGRNGPDAGRAEGA